MKTPGMRTRVEQWFGWLAFAVIGALYAISFFLPFLLIDRHHPLLADPIWDGAIVFMSGMPGAEVSWLANPALWVGLVMLILGRWRAASIAGIVALFIGFLLKMIEIHVGSGGQTTYHLLTGYCVWLASMVLLAGSEPLWFAVRRCAGSAARGVKSPSLVGETP